MSMLRCPDCGEKYSDTYKCCPFCEEEAALRGSQPVRRKGARRSSSRREPGILTPMLLAVILVLALTLAWLFFGEGIKEKLGGGAGPGSSSSQSSNPSQSGDFSVGGAELPGSGDFSEAPDSSGDEEPGIGADTEPDAGRTPDGLTVEQVAALPGTLTLSKQDFTLPVGDPAVKLTASGGGGSYTWYSEDEGIASVDENGAVTAISAGTINIYATDGVGKGLCIVRVRPGSGNSGGSAASPPATSGGEVKLNREDFTLNVGERFQLKSSQPTSAQTWSSSNPGVASVAGDGTVTGVAAGMATVTMSYGGNSVSCIVRVK